MRTSTIATVACMVFLAACAGKRETNRDSQKYDWCSVPIVGGGFVDGFILHPTDKEVRYCRTDMGGAYRWDAGEEKWVQMLDWVSLDECNLQGVESIAVDPTDSRKVYLACGTYTNQNGSILKSADGGKTFKRTDVPIPMGGNENGRGNGERMMVDPKNPSIIYFGTRQSGLWRTIDEGESWSRVESFPDVEEQTSSNDWHKRGSGIIAVVFDEEGDDVSGSRGIYVAVSLKGRENLFVSHDGGMTWAGVEGHPQRLRPTHMVKSSDRKLYITYADTPGPSRMNDGAVWCYDINAGTWNEISPLRFEEGTNAGFGYAAVSVDSHNANHLIVSTHGLWGKHGYGEEEMFRSTDGGSNWTPLFKHGYRYDHSKAPYTKMAPLHWMFDIEIDPSDAEHAYFTTGFGGWETFNLSAGEREGDTIVWSIATDGVEETVPLELYCPPSGARLVSGVGDYGGHTHFDITRPTPQGMHYAPYFGNTDGVTGAWKRPEQMVRVGVIFNHLQDIPAISYSEDGGMTWQGCKTSPMEKAESGHIAVNADGSVWVWTPRGGKPYYTTDKGETWAECQGLPENIRVVADKENPKKLYAVDVLDKAIYRTFDGGITYKRDSLDIELTTTQPRRRGDNRGGQDRIYAMPERESDLWLAAYDGLYHIDGDKPTEKKGHVETIYAFGYGKAATDGGYPSLYIIGVVDGIYGFFRSDDIAESWTRINDDEHQYGLVLHICGDMQEYGRVYVGTHGRGIITGKIK
ncbi:MAG: exo-alpha-sialidase [Bacteroidales bacterium]|nr:exo-alpha-sialidase [Bacteroidales bacterium]